MLMEAWERVPKALGPMLARCNPNSDCFMQRGGWDDYHPLDRPRFIRHTFFFPFLSNILSFTWRCCCSCQTKSSGPSCAIWSRTPASVYSDLVEHYMNLPKTRSFGENMHAIIVSRTVTRHGFGTRCMRRVIFLRCVATLIICSC